MNPTEVTNLEYQDGGKSSVQDFTSSDRGKPWQQSIFYYLKCARTRIEQKDLEYQDGGNDFKI